MELEEQRYGRNKNTVINKTYIESGEYRRKFDLITSDKEMNKLLYNLSKEILYHRSGTLYEDMYWIDPITKEIIFSILESKKKKKIEYLDSLRDILKKNKGLIGIHSHPQSMPPSLADLNAAFNNSYKLGVVICHDGKIFTYSVYEEIPDYYFSQLYVTNLMKLKDCFYAQLKALEILNEQDVIDFKEVIP